MDENTRNQAEPIAEEIMHKLANYLRYNLSCWPKSDDLVEIKRTIKSIIIQHLSRSKVNVTQEKQNSS